MIHLHVANSGLTKLYDINSKLPSCWPGAGSSVTRVLFSVFSGGCNVTRMLINGRAGHAKFSKLCNLKRCVSQIDGQRRRTVGNFNLTQMFKVTGLRVHNESPDTVLVLQGTIREDTMLASRFGSRTPRYVGRTARTVIIPPPASCAIRTPSAAC